MMSILNKIRGIWRRPFGRDRSHRGFGGKDGLLAAVVDGLSEEVMDQLAARSESSSGAARAYATALQKQGREPEAQLFLARSREEHPDDEGLRFQADALARHRYEPLNQAYSLLSLADLEGARKAFAATVAMVGKRLPVESLKSALCGSGWVEMSAGAPGAALDFFRRATRVDPSHMDAHHGIGSALRALKKSNQARPAFAVAANLNRLAPAPLALIGWCHYESANYLPAVKAFRRAMARNSLDLESTWGWAWSLWRSADPDVESAFRSACEVGWHSSGTDLLVLAKHDKRLDALLPAIVLAASVGSPHVADEAADEWLAREERDSLQCAQLLRRAGLHSKLIAWAKRLSVRGPAAVEALQSAIDLEDKEAISTFMAGGDGDCPAALMGRAYDFLGLLEKSSEAYKLAVQEGDLFAFVALDGLERRLRFRSLAAQESKSVSAAEGEAEYVKQILLARKEIDDGESGEAIKRLSILKGQRALELLERISNPDTPKTGAGQLAAEIRGAGLQVPSEICSTNPHLVALSILAKARKKGHLNRRQVRAVLHQAGLDPEDRILAAAAHRALGLLEKNSNSPANSLG